MLAQFPTFDLILWITIAVLHGLLAVLLRRSSYEDRYPRFVLNVYFAALSNVVLILLVALSHPRAYVWETEAACVVGFFLTGLCAAEVYSYVYGPRIALPRGTPRTVALLLTVSLSLTVALGVLLHATKGSHIAQIIVTAEFMVNAAAAVTFWLMVVHSRRLGIVLWRPQIVYITSGFLMQLTPGLITIFLRGNANPRVGYLAGRIGQILYLASLVWWNWCFWEKEPEPTETTDGEVEAVLAGHRNNMDALQEAISSRYREG